MHASIGQFVHDSEVAIYTEKNTGAYNFSSVRDIPYQ